MSAKMSTFQASPRLYELFSLFDHFTIMSAFLAWYISVMMAANL
jgi:hypothetical protein